MIEPTKAQQGGFLGSLLSAIGIPLIMNAITGKGHGHGLQVDKSGSKNRELVYPYQPPPFFGIWNNNNKIGMGTKKKARTSVRQKQPIQWDSIARSNTVMFINELLSNFDLINWIEKLQIKHFRGIFSRDSLPKKIKNEYNSIAPGTHWICYRNIDINYCEYCDSFGLIMPQEIEYYLKTSGKTIYYSGDEIQERLSVLCGYWCLYYLYERQKGKTILEIIHNLLFNMKNQNVKKYVKAKNGRIMLKCTCAECGITKTKFVKKQGN